jgi:hypothetical protein
MSQFIVPVTLVHGSPAVRIVGINETARAVAGVVFLRKNTSIPYFVASSALDGADTVVTLTGAYDGISETAVDGVFAVDFTYPDHIPTLAAGDVGTAAIFTAAMYRVQELVSGVAAIPIPAFTVLGNPAASAAPPTDVTMGELETMLALQSAAFTPLTDYATAAQGVTADAALPKAGGKMTGPLNEPTITTLASAASIDIGAEAANTISITGTATINALGTIAAGAVRRLVFASTATLTYDGTALILPTGATIVAAAGDVAEFVSLGAGNWRCFNYVRASGRPLQTPKALVLTVGDEVSSIVAGAGALTIRLPYAMTLTEVRASLTTASSAGAPAIDINAAGVSILATTITIDEGEKTSVTAATPAAIGTAALADNAEITIDIDSAGAGAAGLKVYLIGH